MKQFAIASGKGGTGKTFLSTHLFAVMEELGFSVTLVDCDAEVPNASLFVREEQQKVWSTQVLCPEIDASKCVFCGRCAQACHFNAITCIPGAHYIKVMPDLCHGCSACLYECPQKAILPTRKEVGKVTAYGTLPRLVEARLKEGEHSPVPVIRDAIAHATAGGADYLILDAPPGCSCPFVNTVMEADEVILVTEPTPFGLNDLKNTVQVLRRLNKPFGVVINRSDLGDEAMKKYLHAEQIPLLAEIPFSKELAFSYSKGELAFGADETLKPLFMNLVKQLCVS